MVVAKLVLDTLRCRIFGLMIDRLNVDRFVDLNIREPWIERSCLLLLIGDCRWLKLSADELAWLSGQDVDEASHRPRRHSSVAETL
jgi:sugar/nucleoside kinase (ribokinase family)